MTFDDSVLLEGTIKRGTIRQTTLVGGPQKIGLQQAPTSHQEEDPKVPYLANITKRMLDLPEKLFREENTNVSLNLSGCQYKICL